MTEYTMAAHQAPLLGIRADRVRQWARRRKLLSVGLDRAGRPLYAVDDVKALAACRVDRRDEICHA